ncbi:assimilatory sulfite reductase (NADPH) flavoprotein subunit [Zobellia galactanivorans]|uniref:assimilatory sulfite reductase (NADPH) n=1 Tax=Zobellia galactanivorans (strain DSM 12802 / CCUG 47099 / CIP 106680 / NCIMB 13871 / Dsij) TaxID=63186 RepID=G0L972_ZOBGA|nr:assimilatory sulfite reductase (NADPH) flavoprotein subunit [Zobellia galactanivorans]CAZ94378.1 Sulfite reductase [NADPH] flavoprotein alpha-component [Zobellia galactanivorans]
MELKKGLERGPFNDRQAEKLSEALSGLDTEQLSWLSGYFSGLGQTSATTVAVTDTNVGIPAQALAEAKPEKLNILFGTHTGNSEALAQNLALEAKERGVEVEVSDMASFKTRDLKKIKNLAVIVSTHGLGEPPVQAEDLHKYLHGKKAPDLSHLNFSVLALGDSSYVDFCQTGKDFDAVLEKLGAKRLAPRQDCDVDYGETAEAWQKTLLDSLVKLTPETGTPTEPSNETATVGEVKYSRKNRFEATVLEKINLNGKGSSKETVHIELDLEGSGLKYEPGDALGVYGSNSPKFVQSVLEATNLSGEELVESHAGEKTLRDALTYDYELTPLTKTTLSKYAELTDSARLKNILADPSLVPEYLQGRDILDLIKEEAHGFSAKELISVLRKNTPRMYSIASSQEAVEDEVHLLVSVVRYQAYGRDKEGLCSTTIADRLEVGDKVEVFVDRNTRFKLPENPDAPVIMVGPGTGVAPFRAFMQHLEVSENRRPSWLFFGDRNFTTDFLYQTEWQQYLKEGVLTKADVAFSRDQEQKQYVQHRMLENGKELFDWLENGAHFYVCGDAQKMAKDVDLALKEIIRQQGGVTLEKAEEYVKNLQLANRYQADIY